MSFDVLDWFAAQNVPLIRIDWRGEVQMVVGGIGYSADPAKVAAQVEAKRKGKTLAIATSLIRQKLENSIATMREALPETPVRDAAIQKLQHHLSLLTRRGAKSIADLLGIEGGIARTYFAAWHSYPLKWKGTGRYPIPDHWRYIGPRQSINTGIKGKNRRASHPVNAILNYAYAVLESEVRIKVIAEGYDPSIGYLHMQNEKRPDPLVFDLMEPLRPVIDRRLLEFAQSHTFHPADFTIRSDGVCRLNPELASQIARVACTSNIRLEHIIKLGN
jgi:CRISPR-associated endonuclease Cas1